MRTTALFAAGLLAVAPLSLSAHEHGAADAGHEGHSGKFESAADCWYPAFKAGDADAVAACYVEDGVMVFPGGPLAQGRPAIRDGYAHFFSENTIKDVQITELGRESHGNSVTVWGRYTVTVAPKAGGADIVATGRFSELSRKVDGKWMYVFDHASDDPPPPPATETAAAPATGT